jgi:predicted nucleic acid-binding protein
MARVLCRFRKPQTWALLAAIGKARAAGIPIVYVNGVTVLEDGCATIDEEIEELSLAYAQVLVSLHDALLRRVDRTAKARGLSDPAGTRRAVTEVVLDASVVLKWFRAEGERHDVPARSLRAAFEAGRLVVFAPPLLHLEIVNVAGRRWHWPEAVLVDLAVSLEELSFDVREPELASVARWTARGLTAYVAAYVALAEGEGIRLVTDDDPIVSVAPGIAIALADHKG